MPEPEASPPRAAAPLARRPGRARLTGITQSRVAESTEPPAAPGDWLRAETPTADEMASAELAIGAEEGIPSESPPANLSLKERREWFAARADVLWREREAGLSPPVLADSSGRGRLAAPRWLVQLARSALLLSVGAAAGFGLSLWRGGGTLARPASNPVAAGIPTIPTILVPDRPVTETSEIERDTDLAYAAAKAKRHAEARERFASLRERFPGQAIFAVEEARNYYYQANYLAAQRLLSENILAGRAVAESHFLLGLVQLAERNYALAQSSFQRSALADPSRPETHFLWAEGLRREGLGAEAARRYQVAWERNQFETNEVAYRLKLWLAQIAEGLLPEESSRQIDAALAASPPTGDALVADAARAVRSGDFARAARRLGEARRTMEPLVFQIGLRDPTFVQEAWRPEMAPLYERKP